MPGACISTNPTSTVTSRLAVPRIARSAKLYRHIQSKLRRKTVRRRAVRVSLLLSNVVVLAVILAVVLQNPRATQSAKPLAANAAESGVAANPLDQLSSADIALTVARLSSLPETTAITNQAQSQAADLAIAASNNNVITKPQVVATTLKSRADIKTYTAQAGDTVSGIAAKFGVTSDSIRWSNSLNGDAVSVGTKLTIPPVNGIVYTVKTGDTADSLANRFRANRDQLIAYNDGEIGGFQIGEQIIVPNGVVAATAAAIAAPGAAVASSWGGPTYGYNGYDYGYCTWYVATQLPVPSNWGNASTWSYYAGPSGWHVSSAPAVGAIAQTPYAAGGLGHVAIVDAVSEDGSQIQIRDMNGIAGWGRVGKSGWISASSYPHFITH